MKKQEIIEMYEENGYEEIDEDKWMDRDNDDDLKINYGNKGMKIIFFKPKEKFPIVFENGLREFKVYRSGDFCVRDNIDNALIWFSDSLPLLKKAIKKSDEIKNE